LVHVSRRAILPLLTPIFLVVPQGLWAHAVLLDSSPRIDSVQSGGEVQIHLRFNTRIDHTRSQMTLFAPDGTEQSVVPAPESPADGLNAEVETKLHGSWRLRWQVLSIDGHITRGDIPFKIQ